MIIKRLLIILLFFQLISCEKSADKQFNTDDEIVAGDIRDVLRYLDTDEIEEFVDSISKENIETIEQLSELISVTYSTESDRAYAIYYWIDKNISYDYELEPSLIYLTSRQIAENTFENKKGVCDGYSKLFCHLCIITSLDPAYIKGNTPSGVSEVQDPLLYGYHAWNAVKIDNKWYLLDATWGRYISRPEYFYNTHLPYEKKWKLF